MYSHALTCGSIHQHKMFACLICRWWQSHLIVVYWQSNMEMSILDFLMGQLLNGPVLTEWFLGECILFLKWGNIAAWCLHFLWFSRVWQKWVTCCYRNRNSFAYEFFKFTSAWHMHLYLGKRIKNTKVWDCSTQNLWLLCRIKQLSVCNQWIGIFGFYKTRRNK